MASDEELNSSQIGATAKKMCLKLQSEDKMVRKQALIDLEVFISHKDNNFSNQDLRNIFTEIQMYAINSLRDKTESVREQGIKFWTFFIIDTLPLNDFYLTYLLPVLVERIGSVEIIEESEEIRYQLLQFLHAIISKYSQTAQLKPFLDDCVTILKETTKDKYPSIKELSCKVIVDLAHALPRDFHMQAENLVKPILTCFTHQRYRVRVEAVQAIGEVIMHSSYKGLNEAIVPMAERLFDQIPVVRRTVAQIAFKWLTEYRDRYSFFHKLLPLIMTGLNDEVVETRQEAQQLWEQVGMQFQKENEKELKEQLDYILELPKYYPDQLKRPNLGCRILVKRNISKLAPALSSELASWQADIRVRCSQLLCSVAWHAEDDLTQNLQELLPAMYSAARDDDKRVVDNIEEASKIIGLFVPPQTWYRLLIPTIDENMHWGHMSVLANLIEGTPQEYICNRLYELSAALSHDGICFTRKKQFQIKMANCIKAILQKYNEKSNPEVGYYSFKISIALHSLKDADNPESPLEILHELKNVLEVPGNVWSKYLGRLLNDIDVDPESWTVITPQRCIFETILLESGDAFGENFEHIGNILVKSLDTECDAEARLKTFWALSEAFNVKDTLFKDTSQVGHCFKKLIMEVFVPSLVWRAGRSAEAMRTMSATCLKCALMPVKGVDLFDSGNTMQIVFDKLVPLLLSLIEDASYRSRSLAMECLVLLKENADNKGIWMEDDLVKIYPEILKRLDDPTDSVRNCAMKVLPDIFKDCPGEFKSPHYKSHHELIIDTLLTHFDDDEVQALVYEILKTVAPIQRELLESRLQASMPLLKNRKGCEDLLEYLKNMTLNS